MFKYGSTSDASIYREPQKIGNLYGQLLKTQKQGRMDLLWQIVFFIIGKRFREIKLCNWQFKCQEGGNFKMTHEQLLVKHLDVIKNKTKEKIRYSFFWPCMSWDVEEYCKSCKDCQLRSRKKISNQTPIVPIQKQNDHLNM